MTDDATAAPKRVALVCTNFTFEGLHMIRPDQLERLRYYPTGIDPSGAEVDRYTAELREKMDRKDIPFIEDMLQMAQLEGVRFLACKTSADLFDLEQKDFIDGVEIMLASDFLKHATSSDLHLMF